MKLVNEANKHYTTNTTLVCVLLYISSAVILSFCVSFRYLSDSVADRCEILRDGRALFQT